MTILRIFYSRQVASTRWVFRCARVLTKHYERCELQAVNPYSRQPPSLQAHCVQQRNFPHALNAHRAFDAHPDFRVASVSFYFFRVEPLVILENKLFFLLYFNVIEFFRILES